MFVQSVNHLIGIENIKMRNEEIKIGFESLKDLKVGDVLKIEQEYLDETKI